MLVWKKNDTAVFVPVLEEMYSVHCTPQYRLHLTSMLKILIKRGRRCTVLPLIMHKLANQLLKKLLKMKWVDESVNKHKDCVPASTVYPI